MTIKRTDREICTHSLNKARCVVTIAVARMTIKRKNRKHPAMRRVKDSFHDQQGRVRPVVGMGAKAAQQRPKPSQPISITP
jgi:hypothetical protein